MFQQITFRVFLSVLNVNLMTILIILTASYMFNHHLRETVFKNKNLFLFLNGNKKHVFLYPLITIQNYILRIEHSSLLFNMHLVCYTVSIT